MSTDTDMLYEYFCSLSDDTRRFFGPHLFDRRTTEELAREIHLERILRMVAIVKDRDRERIVGYFSLWLELRPHDKQRFPEADEGYAAIAPSVADEYQGKGLGTQLMKHIIDVARVLGKRRLVLGGTDLTNKRAIHFYQKVGFKIVRTVYSQNGMPFHDMVLDLS